MMFMRWVIFRQTEHTANHEHDFGGSQLVINQENGACRISGTLIAAMNTLAVSLAQSSLCIVDIAEIELVNVVATAIPIARKMGKLRTDEK